MALSTMMSRLGKVLPAGARERIAPLVPFTRTARLYRLLRPPLKPLDAMLATPEFGLGLSERAVEIPWVLGKYRGEQRVLEIGHAHAIPPYVALLQSLSIPELHGLDLVNGPHKEFIQTVGDVRKPPYRDGFFDFILCVSTIEHVGLDNTVYGTQEKPREGGDFVAMRELFRILKPGGRLVVTVPYGAARDYGWQIQYDATRLDQLLAAAPFEVVSVEYFGHDTRGWSRKRREELAQAEYAKGAPNAAGLACAELRRPAAS